MLKSSSEKTLANLKEAFAGESQANRKYLSFAAKADEEGYPQVAKLFRAAAEAETVHALAHFRAMGGVKSTKENLHAAVSGETFEFKNMYPGMIEQAGADGEDAAQISFMNANAVEQIHAKLYQKYIDNLGNTPVADIYVCQVCGNTVEGEAPDVCPVCGAQKSKFKKID
ncbi:MAG: rubrerythrin family protein [Actinobacteria bacterium]|nr:rubrerythrin family protein [Actinomycetota bacterium]